MMGSGTTGVAALHQGVAFTGIETNPVFFELACQRIRLEYDQLKLFNGEVKSNG
jgi:DNA modification methylase